MKRVPLLEAVSDVSGGNRKILQSDFLPEGPLAVVDQGRSQIAGYTYDTSASVKANGPVIVFGDHTRAIKFVDFPFAMGADGVKVLQVREGFDPKFVYHYLSSRELPSAGYSRHFKFLKQVEVPQPHIEEQRRIAALLDHADALRAKRRQVLAHLDVLTQSIFNFMFGSREFKSLPLGAVASWSSGKFLPAKSQAGGSVPVYGGNGVNGFHDEIMFGEKRLIVGRVGANCGAVHLTQPGCWVTDNALVASLKREDVDLEFLKQALIQANLNQYANVSGQPSISGGRIGDVQITVPPLELQRAFAARVVELSDQKRRVAAVLGIDNELFASLQSRAFKGEL